MKTMHNYNYGVESRLHWHLQVLQNVPLCPSLVCPVSASVDSFGDIFWLLTTLHDLAWHGWFLPWYEPVWSRIREERVLVERIPATISDTPSCYHIYRKGMDISDSLLVCTLRGQTSVAALLWLKFQQELRNGGFYHHFTVQWPNSYSSFGCSLYLFSPILSSTSVGAFHLLKWKTSWSS